MDDGRATALSSLASTGVLPVTILSAVRETQRCMQLTKQGLEHLRSQHFLVHKELQDDFEFAPFCNKTAPSNPVAELVRTLIFNPLAILIGDAQVN